MKKSENKISFNIISELEDLPCSSDEVRKKVSKIQKELIQIQKIVPAPDVIYDWDQYFMSIACLAALRSKDPSTPVS